MCVYSNVMDHYQPLIPVPVEPAKPFVPGVSPLPWSPPVDVEELKKLIADFKEAMAAAKVVDEKVGHPDCADPEKEKLVARVAELEKAIGSLTAREPIVYRCQLAGGFLVEATLPKGFTRKDYARLVRWLDTLVDDEPNGAV